MRCTVLFFLLRRLLLISEGLRAGSCKATRDGLNQLLHVGDVWLPAVELLIYWSRAEAGGLHKGICCSPPAG
jgi:hypothetical protein